MEKEEVAGGETPSTAKTFWTYGYEMIPPYREDRMTTIRAFLDRESDQAKREDRTWTARWMTERRVTHLLIVSGNPELDIEVNRKLEAELRTLGIGFLATVPLPVGDGSEPSEGSFV